ncbi:GTP-binding protein [Purpureocillium lavendulum]|uniref:GTP-binding protein n=1 Tax=Purpureocillium lavendulum TaxID=1247861 RepID=A0AB34G1R4_9HYPO|nr:GTP-binding protein [Purpureocillium lavendulum]
MASIFTYDPDPPRVSSPWLAPEDSTNQPPKASPGPGLLSDYGVTKLQAEPQEGPTEYKLHLLLRPRRAYTSVSTARRASGSQQAGPRETNPAKPSPVMPASSSQSRQERLQHLTTQLLWRLQQSSPYHATSSKELTTPKLPDDSVDLRVPIKLEALVPGLEESRGALYEIGVSDDGTLVGLTKDEMSESIATLRVMAASLGCNVDIVRTVIVGECEWTETDDDNDAGSLGPTQRPRHGKLWVAEALVTPNLGFRDYVQPEQELSSGESTGVKTANTPELAAEPRRGSSATPQLRVTLTGPTTSGKSSLLGTLSTGTLDNGRGKSRLGLLKHRHELVSGVTSSIAQELIGYKDQNILNFSQGNIESWIDIHDCADNGKLVFVSDSGGHPRYRRTVLRGLMNWAPHWSILCIAADANEESPNGVGATSSARDVLGAAAAGVDLVKAHLALSLKLDVPMAIVITKLDLASKLSLQKTMSKILTAIKEAGRVPKILQPDQRQHYELKQIPPEDRAKVQSLVHSIEDSGSLTSQVPIVLTSSVKGIGIGLVHALLEGLPLPPPPTARDYVGMALNPEQPKCLFHVDDTFSLASSYGATTPGPRRKVDQGVVVSGHVRFGNLSVGDKIVVGPFQPEDEESRGFSIGEDDRPSPGSYGLSISHPASAELARIAMKNAVPASTIAGEWHRAQIVSIRNLRLPVRTLEAGQAGSVGLIFELGAEHHLPVDEASGCEIPRIRRGMVLAIPSKHMLDTGLSLQAASGFTATFPDPAVQGLTIGSFVNVYVASVRAAARILRVSRTRWTSEARETPTEDIDDMFSLSGDGIEDSGEKEALGKGQAWEISLELLHNREWIEMGSKVILLEGGSQDRSGLEGHVGSVIEIVD